MLPRRDPAELLRVTAGVPLEELVRAKLATFFSQLGDERVEGLYDLVMRQVERPLFELALARAGGRLADAAARLGIHRNTLRRRLRALGLRP